MKPSKPTFPAYIAHCIVNGVLGKKETVLDRYTNQEIVDICWSKYQRKYEV